MSDLTPSPDKSGEITARLEAATALPWDIFRYRNGGGRIHIDEKAQPERHRDLIADMEPAPDDIVTVYSEGDRELLFHAPEDIRYLLGRVKELEAQISEARAAILDPNWFQNNRLSDIAKLLAKREATP